MDTIVKNAAIALRPIEAVRTRLAENTLTVGPTLTTLILVLIACNAWLIEAQRFFLDALVSVGFPENPLRDHPLLSDFSRYMSLAVTSLVPLVCIAILPAGLFAPRGRATVVSAVIVTLTASSFYTLVLFSLTFYGGGLYVLAWPPDVLPALLTNPYALASVLFVLFAVIWLRIALSVLALPWTTASLLGLIYWGISGALYWLYFVYVMMALQVATAIN